MRRGAKDEKGRERWQTPCTRLTRKTAVATPPRAPARAALRGLMQVACSGAADSICLVIVRPTQPVIWNQHNRRFKRLRNARTCLAIFVVVQSTAYQTNIVSLNESRTTVKTRKRLVIQGPIASPHWQAQSLDEYRRYLLESERPIYFFSPSNNVTLFAAVYPSGFATDTFYFHSFGLPRPLSLR